MNPKEQLLHTTVTGDHTRQITQLTELVGMIAARLEEHREQLERQHQAITGLTHDVDTFRVDLAVDVERAERAVTKACQARCEPLGRDFWGRCAWLFGGRP